MGREDFMSVLVVHQVCFMEKGLQAAIREALQKWKVEDADPEDKKVTADVDSNSPSTVQSDCEMLMTTVMFPTCLGCGNWLSKVCVHSPG